MSPRTTRLPPLALPCRAVAAFRFSLAVFAASGSVGNAGESSEAEFFERRIRPILVEHCYECHSEQAGEQQGGLLLDRQSGWLKGGETNKAVLPGQPDSSLLISAIRYDNGDLQMPPDGPLDAEQQALLTLWVQRGAPGPADDLGATEFSRLGDQVHLGAQAKEHWAFQPLNTSPPPKEIDGERAETDRPTDSGQRGGHLRSLRHPIDRFVAASLAPRQIEPSPPADPRTLIRRIYYDLSGLPPSVEKIDRFLQQFAEAPQNAIDRVIDQLLQQPAFGQHFGRLWLDVARYADTDSAYRPDTKTPHYFPFAFTYRDYVVGAFNADKPYDVFVREQLAADLMGVDAGDPEMAALGFLAAGPHANRAAAEALDDWIDVTTRGLMGITVACARCHDHKFEPIPTADYYALRGVFAAVTRVHPLDESKQPQLVGYQPTAADWADYQTKRAAIDAKIADSQGKKAKNNNRSIAQKIRETELAELLLFHQGAPARAMRVIDRKNPPGSYIFVRGDATARGEPVPRRFLSVLDPSQAPFADSSSGRLELAERITDPSNPLTARVLVNRVWGRLMGSHLVATPSDFGLQGSPPTHPRLLDWLAHDFIEHDWSLKHLVRQIVSSNTYQQTSDHRPEAARMDPTNALLWRANRKRLSIEAIRDSMLSVAGQLDCRVGGRAEEIWGERATRRRAIYGFINRFNMDPTLRAFDFPAPLQTQPARTESIVAPQSLFTLNSPFVIDQAEVLARRLDSSDAESDDQRIDFLFRHVLGRAATEAEIQRTQKLVDFQRRLKNANRQPARFKATTWALVAQALLMSNEFQYVD